MNCGPYPKIDCFKQGLCDDDYKQNKCHEHLSADPTTQCSLFIRNATFQFADARKQTTHHSITESSGVVIDFSIRKCTGALCDLTTTELAFSIGNYNTSHFPFCDRFPVTFNYELGSLQNTNFLEKKRNCFCVLHYFFLTTRSRFVCEGFSTGHCLV